MALSLSSKSHSSSPLVWLAGFLLPKKGNLVKSAQHRLNINWDEGCDDVTGVITADAFHFVAPTTFAKQLFLSVSPGGLLRHGISYGTSHVRSSDLKQLEPQANSRGKKSGRCAMSPSSAHCVAWECSTQLPHGEASQGLIA